MRLKLHPVSSQLFGPCVLPFGLEKQTLLRLALHEVMTAEINIYDSQVKLVRASRAYGRKY